MSGPEADPTAEEGRAEVADLLLRLRRQGIADRRLAAAFEAVPRRLFVPAEDRADAYAERLLPLPCGQTMTPPELVGRMVAALGVEPDDRVLEIGTGSGYQTAILAALAKRVFTVDRFRTLTEAAALRLRTLRLAHVTVETADGLRGWRSEAPFDRIVVTGAAERVPPRLLDQLEPGGVVVMPVGPPDEAQKLTRIERTDRGLSETVLGDVRFVALIPGTAERLNRTSMLLVQIRGV